MGVDLGLIALLAALWTWRLYHPPVEKPLVEVRVGIDFGKADFTAVMVAINQMGVAFQRLGMATQDANHALKRMHEAYGREVRVKGLK